MSEPAESWLPRSLSYLGDGWTLLTIADADQQLAILIDHQSVDSSIRTAQIHGEVQETPLSGQETTEFLSSLGIANVPNMENAVNQGASAPDAAWSGPTTPLGADLTAHSAFVWFIPLAFAAGSVAFDYFILNETNPVKLAASALLAAIPGGLAGRSIAVLAARYARVAKAVGRFKSSEEAAKAAIVTNRIYKKYAAARDRWWGRFQSARGGSPIQVHNWCVLRALICSSAYSTITKRYEQETGKAVSKEIARFVRSRATASLVAVVHSRCGELVRPALVGTSGDFTRGTLKLLWPN